MNIDTKKNNSFYFLLFLFATIAGFSLILVFKKSLYETITYEDCFVEYLGFIFLFIAGFFLLYSSILRLRKKIKMQAISWLLLIMGIIFIIAAFEEISWGQRIFGFDTPDKLMEINKQE